MSFEKGQTLKANDIIFYILDIEKYENEDYLYLAKMEDDDITEDFHVYKVDKETNKLIHITDSEKLKVILPLFIKNLQAEINS